MLWLSLEEKWVEAVYVSEMEKAVLAMYLLCCSNKRVLVKNDTCMDVGESEHSRTVSGETEVTQHKF